MKTHKAILLLQQEEDEASHPAKDITQTRGDVRLQAHRRSICSWRTIWVLLLAIGLLETWLVIGALLLTRLTVLLTRLTVLLTRLPVLLTRLLIWLTRLTV